MARRAWPQPVAKTHPAWKIHSASPTRNRSPTSSGLAAPEFCERLLRETGVMVFPGTMFGDESTDYIRISYLQPLPLIQEAMRRISEFTHRARSAS